MTTPARISTTEALTTSGASPPRPAPVDVSPAIGPLPAIAVPSTPGDAPVAGLLWQGTVRAARWVAHHLTTLHGRSTTRSAPAPPRRRGTSTGVTMSDIPADLRYSNDHLWARQDPRAGLVRVGVTDFAQQALGDDVAVTLPAPEDAVQAAQACGDIESVKSVSDLIAPVTGTVRTCNADLAKLTVSPRELRT